jgi:hypothetical protein
MISLERDVQPIRDSMVERTLARVEETMVSQSCSGLSLLLDDAVGSLERIWDVEELRTRY